MAELVTHCPELRIVATSRTPLRIAVEREYPLAPLEVPSWAGTLRLAGIRAFDRAWDAFLEDGRVRVEPA